MQTFLPYSDFVRSVRCLDSRRLGKQRVEAWQILSALVGLKYSDAEQCLIPVDNTRVGWAHHPAVLQWKGYEYKLLEYLEACIQEWARRGYSNAKMQVILEALYDSDKFMAKLIETREAYPPWLGRTPFHNSHKSNLLRKHPAYYQKFKWKVSAELPYIWPVTSKEKTHAV